MSSIILTTLNARYSHSSLGLRYLQANMGSLQEKTSLREYIINTRPIDIVEDLLNHSPLIVGIGVYIWNVEQTTQVVALLKQVRPDIIVVLGGPEVSYEIDQQAITSLADYVITGPGDVSFGRLCQDIINDRPPAHRIIAGQWVPLAELVFPYAYYTAEDIANRVIYVEASRGCPFKCEFCLSALDKTAWPFELEHFLAEMDKLYQRGARQFKFVDRTFNLNIATSIRILEFFLERLDEHLFLHFEVIPDHLPERLKQAIMRFPPGRLQLEIGVQTFNPEVQTLISRKQDNAKTEANLRWLNEHTEAHLHVDLIIGLPGEDVASFAQGFNRLVALGSPEIQVGILKRLRGAPISRHTERHDLRFSPVPPYTLLCSDEIDFATMQRLTRFARYWDLIANSGRFRHSVPLILAENPFEHFMRLSDWIFATSGQTHHIALERLFVLLHQAMIDDMCIEKEQTENALLQDYQLSGLKGFPKFMNRGNPQQVADTRQEMKLLARQARHVKS